MEEEGLKKDEVDTIGASAKNEENDAEIGNIYDKNGE